jgi:endonuclease III
MEQRKEEMDNRGILKKLIGNVGGRFSVAIGIDLSSQNPEEIFKWFLASVLFGTRISERIVIKTYKEFEKEGILSPESILNTGWGGLVEILDRGGYVRYDFKTATKLLDLSTALTDKYGDDLNVLHSTASGPRDLEARLKALAKGIGDVTVNIFLREMRGIWGKAEPFPSDLVVMAAKHIGIISVRSQDRGKVLAFLKKKWTDEGMEMKDFPDFEAALLRLGKDYCRKGFCDRCSMKCECRRIKG